MLEKWRRSVGKIEVFGALLANFSQAVGCLCYEILNPNLNTYGVSLLVLRMMYDFVLHRKQATKISSSCSGIVLGVFIF